jgi:hypothetical protein
LIPTADHLAFRRFARYALTFALMAMVGVANQPFLAASPHESVSAGFQQFAALPFVWARPARSVVDNATTRLAQSEEVRNECDSKELRFLTSLIGPGSAHRQFATQSLSFITPDHLIELPGTPPPVLRL